MSFSLAELQRIAGRAERLRSDAVRQGQRGLASLPALEAEARRTRDEAAAFGEALIARRLEHERRSGANPTPNPDLTLTLTPALTLTVTVNVAITLTRCGGRVARGARA